VRGGKVPSLKELTVNLAGIGQEGMQAFAGALSTSHASALRRLEVRFGGVSPADAAAEVGLFSVALSSGHLCRLEELCVEGLRVIDEVRALYGGLGSGKLTSLLTLCFVFCRLWTAGGRALSEVLVAEKLPSLRTLSAQTADLADEGVRALIEGWTNREPPPLQCVDLGGDALSHDVVNPLLRFLGSKRLPALQSLNVSGPDSGLDSGSFGDPVNPWTQASRDLARNTLFRVFPEIVNIL